MKVYCGNLCFHSYVLCIWGNMAGTPHYRAELVCQTQQPPNPQVLPPVSCSSAAVVFLSQCSIEKGWVCNGHCIHVWWCVWLKQKLWLFHSIHTHSLFHTPLGLSWTSTKMVLFWLWTWNVAHWQSWGTEVKGQEVQVSIRYPKLKQLLYNKWLNC